MAGHMNRRDLLWKLSEFDEYSEMKRHFEVVCGARVHDDNHNLIFYDGRSLSPEQFTHAYCEVLHNKKFPKFLRTWRKDRNAETIKFDAFLVDQSIRIPRFDEVIPNRPKTLESDAIALGYDIYNLKGLMWHATADFVIPRFSKNHKMCTIMIDLANSINLRSFCDDIVCSLPKSVYELNVFTVLGDENGQKLSPLIKVYLNNIGLTSVFYGGLCHRDIEGIYNPLHGKYKPLPNKFSIYAAHYVKNLLHRYKLTMESVNAYVENYARPDVKNFASPERFNDFRNWSRKTQKCIKTIDKQLSAVMHACDEVITCDMLIKEYLLLEPGTSHTTHTLELLPCEELRAMVEGHPSKLDLQDIY